MLRPARGLIQTDISWQALSFLKERFQGGEGPRRVACDATHLPFLSGSLNGVICSEVLEHIENDELVLEEIHRVLKPGGAFFLTCPVHQGYFGFDDEFVGHFRRYEPSALKNRLLEKGFVDCQMESLMGPLEKKIMEQVTRCFSKIKGDGRATLHYAIQTGIRILAWLLYPFYFFANLLLGAAVYFQGQRVPLDKAVTVSIRCRKKV